MNWWMVIGCGTFLVLFSCALLLLHVWGIWPEQPTEKAVCGVCKDTASLEANYDYCRQVVKEKDTTIKELHGLGQKVWGDYLDCYWYATCRDDEGYCRETFSGWGSDSLKYFEYACGSAEGWEEELRVFGSESEPPN